MIAIRLIYYCTTTVTIYVIVRRYYTVYCGELFTVYFVFYFLLLGIFHLLRNQKSASMFILSSRFSLKHMKWSLPYLAFHSSHLNLLSENPTEETFTTLSYTYCVRGDENDDCHQKNKRLSKSGYGHPSHDAHVFSRSFCWRERGWISAAESWNFQEV